MAYANIWNRDNPSAAPSGGGAGGTYRWQDVLSYGNTTGAYNPTIDSGQAVNFTAGINIGGGGSANVTVTPAISTVLVGGGATASSTECTVIGKNANAGALQGCTLVGNTASASGGGGSTVVGWNAAAGTGSTALGWLSQATGSNSTAVGISSTTGVYDNSVAIGNGATCSASNQIRLGRATETTSIIGSLVMNPGTPTASTLAGMLTLGNCAGTPTGISAAGSLVFDSTNNLFYGRDNVSWKTIQTGTAATPTWSSVLAAGNSSGANNPTINSGNNIIFTGEIRIGGGNSSPLAGVDNTTIYIGNGAGSGTNRASSVCIGNSATGQGDNSTAIGANASASAAQSTAVGKSSIASNGSTAVGYTANSGNLSVAIGNSAVASASGNVSVGQSATDGQGVSNVSVGYQAATGSLSNTSSSIAIGAQAIISGTNSQNVLIGAASTQATGCSSSVLVGGGSSQASSCSSSVLIGSGSTQSASKSNVVAIGQGITVNGTNSIIIGAGQAGGGDNTIAIGRGSILLSTSTGAIYIGNNQVDSPNSNTKCVLIGDSTSIVAGAVCTRSVGLMPGAVIAAGSTDKLFGSVAWAGGTSAAGITLSTDANGMIHPNSSSIRFKHDVKPLREPERIYKLRAVDFAMKNDPTGEIGMTCGCPNTVLDEETGEWVINPCSGLHSRDVGGIAEEVANADMEDFVVFGPDPTNPDKKRCLSIKYDRLVFPIIEVLKLQKDKLDAQQTHIDFVDNENKLLLDRVTVLELENTALKAKVDWIESKLLQLNL